MSSEIIENNSLIKQEEENDKNEDINNFSRNFNKNFQKLKKLDDKNNKNNNISSEDENKNNINNNLSNTSIKQNNNKSLLNSLVDFDLINNTNTQIQNTKNDTKSKIKSNTKKSPNKTNNSYLPLSSSSRDNLICTTNIVQTTTVQSGKIKNLKKKYINSKKNTKLKKNKSLQNLKKCSFSQTKFESFLERVKEKQKMKELHINNIRCKSLEGETSEMHTHPKINKTSLNLLKNRKPLYQEKPLKEEKNLEKNFKDFYARTFKENQTNTYFEKYQKNKNKNKNMINKYNKFYEDKIKWKKNVEQKNKNRKLNIDQEYDEYIDNFSFKPSLDKNSIYIANKLNRNRSIENFSNNNFFESGNNIETLEKFKTKLKPIIKSFYNYNNHQPMLNRKNGKFRRTLSEINFNPKLNVNNGNGDNKHIKKKNKPKINYKINEKKYIKIKNNDKYKIKDMNYNLNINEKDYYLLEQIEEINNKKKIKYENQDLYKLNVRPGAAWNNEVINKITPLEEYYDLVEGLL